MAQIIRDGLLVCEDCTVAIANNDYTGLDYHYSPQEAEERETAIRHGIANMGGYPVIGDEYGFTWRGCDCCKSPLGGTKHECVVLGN